MVGKKKTDDVQFYTEVGEAVQTLDGGRRSMYDPDEIEEEQRERDVRNKVSQSTVLDALCLQTRTMACSLWVPAVSPCDIHM